MAATQAFLAAATIAYTVNLLSLRMARGGGDLRNAVRFPPVKLPLLLFCLATINSVLWAEHPYAGGFALRKLVLFLILLLSVNLVVSARHLGWLFRALFGVAALAGLVGAAQFVIQYHEVRQLHHNLVYFYMTVTRTRGFMGHWMNFGGQQMLVFAVLLAYLLLSHGVTGSPPQKEEGQGGGGPQSEHFTNRPSVPSFTRRGIMGANSKGLYWLLMAVVATSIVLSFTRSVWLGCVVAVLYVVARWKPPTLWVVPVLLFVAYLAAPSLIRRRVSQAFHPSQDAAVGVRLEMWSVGMRMVRAHPWTGVGPGDIPLVYNDYLPPGVKPIPGYHDHLHDDLLQMAAERGLPCMISWVWFMLAVGVETLRVRRRLVRLRWVADAAIAAWLAFIAEGIFEFNFGATPVLMVFLFVMSTPFIAEYLENRERGTASTL